MHKGSSHCTNVLTPRAYPEACVTGPVFTSKAIHPETLHFFQRAPIHFQAPAPMSVVMMQGQVMVRIETFAFAGNKLACLGRGSLTLSKLT